MKHSKLFLYVLVVAFLFVSCNEPDEAQKQASNTTADEQTGILVFSTKDLENNIVTNDVFANYDLTLVNVWGTFCGPCKAEMPDLEAAYKEYATKKCNVIAITIDLSEDDNSNLELAKEILKDAGCSFKALYNVADFDKVTSMLSGVPATFFVDKNGEIIKDSLHIGRTSTDEFKKLFEKHLATVK